MDDGSRAAEDGAYFTFCPSRTHHHIPFSTALWYVPYAFTVDMILSYGEQETENEFPFLEAVYTPPSQPKVEYGSFLILCARKEADKKDVALCLSTASTLGAEVTTRTKHGAIRMAPSGRGTTCRRISRTRGCSCTDTT